MVIGNIEIEKHKFHRYKNLILLNDIDTDNILISKKISCSVKNYKYFISYLDDFKMKPFSKSLLKASV